MTGEPSEVKGEAGEHTRDEDCVGHVDQETFTCVICGTYHDPAGCEGCGGHGFHRTDDCPVQHAEYDWWRS